MNIYKLTGILAIGIALSPTTTTRATLVGHWPLDGDANDSTSNHTYVVHGTHIAWSSSDKVAGSGSLQLNSGNKADTWIQIADKPDLQFGTNDFSVCFWVKKLHASANYSDTYGVDKWKSGADPGANEWVLSLSTGSSPVGDDKPSMGFENTSGNRYGVSNPNNMTLSAWHFLVGVRRNSVLEFYLDGVFAGSTTLPVGTAINNVDGGRDLYIGMSAQGAGFGANALYDDLQIYNHALGNGGVSLGQVAGGEIAFLYANPGLVTAPTILNQPISQAVLPGSNATFAVTSALNPFPLSYQWRLNTTNLIANATNATLTITDVGLTNLGFYDVLITNVIGSTLSLPAELSFPRLGITLLSDLVVQIKLEAPVGASNSIQTSANLKIWGSLTNFVVPMSPFLFNDAIDPSLSNRYYRAVFYGP